MRRIAHRNVQLVRGDDVRAGVAELPPELMADHGHIERALRPMGFCTPAITREVARNKASTMRTGITVHASSTWLLPYTCGGSVPSSDRASEPRDDVDEQTEHDHEDDRRYDEHETRQLEDRIRPASRRPKYW